MEQMRKLPIGIQTFEKLREENYLYVDKTALVYRIASTSVPYFLSRPRPVSYTHLTLPTKLEV